MCIICLLLFLFLFRAAHLGPGLCARTPSCGPAACPQRPGLAALAVRPACPQEPQGAVPAPCHAAGPAAAGQAARGAAASAGPRAAAAATAAAPVALQRHHSHARWPGRPAARAARRRTAQRWPADAGHPALQGRASATNALGCSGSRPGGHSSGRGGGGRGWSELPGVAAWLRCCHAGGGGAPDGGAGGAGLAGTHSTQGCYSVRLPDVQKATCFLCLRALWVDPLLSRCPPPPQDNGARITPLARALTGWRGGWAPAAHGPDPPTLPAGPPEPRAGGAAGPGPTNGAAGPGPTNGAGAAGPSGGAAGGGARPAAGDGTASAPGTSVPPPSPEPWEYPAAGAGAGGGGAAGGAAAGPEATAAAREAAFVAGYAEGLAEGRASMGLGAPRLSHVMAAVGAVAAAAAVGPRPAALGRLMLSAEELELLTGLKVRGRGGRVESRAAAGLPGWRRKASLPAGAPLSAASRAPCGPTERRGGGSARPRVSPPS
jgi:hypothetical protein